MLVALRKESVDRNCQYARKGLGKDWSLSARRAWIEISSGLDDILAGVVALRKESVDRNARTMSVSTGLNRSLSARRAWIEMTSQVPTWFGMPSRSPQGERG